MTTYTSAHKKAGNIALRMGDDRIARSDIARYLDMEPADLEQCLLFARLNSALTITARQLNDEPMWFISDTHKPRGGVYYEKEKSPPVLRDKIATELMTIAAAHETNDLTAIFLEWYRGK